MQPKTCNKLFVYGTLRSKHKNSYSLFLRRNSEFVGKGYFFGQLYDVGYYPGAVYEPGCDEKVFGDILFLKEPAKILEKLDAYEGLGTSNPFPYEYRREVISVCHNDQTMWCWAYLYNHPVERLMKIASGNYMQYIRNNA